MAWQEKTPETKIAEIVRLVAEGYRRGEVARRVGVDPETVRRYAEEAGLRHLYCQPDPRNPLYDPRRDGYVEGDITATLMGDPQPNRRELLAKVAR